MSEYQCYEFVALERPLTAKQMAELRAVSTRAEITPTRFRNEYHWGDFKGDAAKLVARYFDAHLYFANWGTRRLMLRLPSKQVATKSLRPYFVGDATRASRTGQHVIVDLCSDQDGSNYDENGADEGSLAALTPLRTELARGDFRIAYLAWLLALQAGDVAEDAIEPLVPPGLSNLTAAQQAMVEFLRLDRDLVTAAVSASPALANDSAAARRWVLALSPREKDCWLERAFEDPDLALGAELLRSFREQTQIPPRGPRRRAAELLATAEDVRAKRERGLARPPSRSPAVATKRKRH
ncbi:MAG TPA: hypothetical protein VER12_16660 [Polyangiaceae bacterium]|nr:hypothetical protein [Polyangiaceae bacterium]